MVALACSNNDDLKFVLITGLSGAGKSMAAGCFEDLGYFCVDNLPPTFIPKFAELCLHSRGRINRVALVCDIRGGEFFESLTGALNNLEEMGLAYEVLFLEAEDEILIRRFKETRRRHPLPEKSLAESLHRERKALAWLRGRANSLIDTTLLNPGQLKERIAKTYTGPHRQRRTMDIRLVSFGFKYGLPLEADLVFDVRFLPNPHYVRHLCHLGGDDPQVRDYVMRWGATHKLLQKIRDLLDFALPHYVREGKSILVIAIGCTGGKHRSVVLINELRRVLADRYSLWVDHRDMDKV